MEVGIINSGSMKQFFKCDGCCDYGGECGMKHEKVRKCFQCKGKYGTCCWKNYESGINNKVLCWGCVEKNIEKVLGFDNWTRPEYNLKNVEVALIENLDKVMAGIINGDFTKKDLLKYIES